MLYKLDNAWINLIVSQEHGIVFSGHIDRNYRQAETGAWVPEGADVDALTCTHHPVLKGVRNSWNITVDTVKVHHGVATRCSDGVSVQNRAAYNEVNHSIHIAQRWVKNQMVGKRSRMVKSLRFAGKTYLGVTLVLQPSGAWLAVSHEGIIN